MITRFAPSPTGLLHLGNARTAIISYFAAKSSKGKFILRLDDTDTTRIKQEYVDKIFNDLLWLGIKEDLYIRQSERFELYASAVAALTKKGRIYPCYETPEELEIERRASLARGLPPVYRKKKYTDSFDKAPYYRFELNPTHIVSWEDKLRGKIVIDLRSTSDPIVLRENGTYTYMLPSVVDDIDCGVNTIIRGEDHISNTAVQIQMFEALGCNRIPEFAHMPLLKMQDGKISKRVGGHEIEALRAAFIEPEVVSTYLLNLGNKSLINFENFKEYERFNLSSYASSSSINVLIDEIYQLNAKFLRGAKYEDLIERLENSIPKEFWEAVKKNIMFLSEVMFWWKMCTTSEKFSEKGICDVNLMKDAISLLPPGEISQETYKQWVALLVEECKYGKKDVYVNLRLALTGRESGPEMAAILPFIGRERILVRLSGQCDA